jgi:hypothetical protein
MLQCAWKAVGAVCFTPTLHIDFDPSLSNQFCFPLSRRLNCQNVLLSLWPLWTGCNYFGDHVRQIRQAPVSGELPVKVLKNSENSGGQWRIYIDFTMVSVILLVF